MGGGVAHHQFGIDGDGSGMGARNGVADDPQQDGCCGLAHAAQGLMNGGERRVVGGGGQHIVKADHRNVLGNAQRRFAQGENGSNSGQVVESEDSGEGPPGLEQLPGDLKSRAGARLKALQLHHELRIDGDNQRPCFRHNGLPAPAGIGALYLTFNEGNALVSQCLEMSKGKVRGLAMVQFDIDDAFAVLVAGDGDEGGGEILADRGIDGDDALDRAGQQHAWVFAQQIGAVSIVDAAGWRPTPGQLDRYGREIPDELYGTPEFDRIIALKARTQAIARNLTEFMKKTDRFAKTIVFCVDQEHAEEMRKELNNCNSDLAQQYPDYVVRIVSDEGDIGRGYPDIDPENALRFPLREIGDRDRVDVIVTNPPFGGEEERGILSNFPEDKQTAETALLFLQLIMRKLRRPVGGAKAGRCGMVVPNGVLFGDGLCARIKEELLKDFNLHTIVRLPNGVFAPYTPILTNLLFFDRSGPTKEVWYYEQPLPEGRKNYSKTAPIQFEEFANCLAWWKKREENEYAWKITAEELLSTGCNLDRKNPHAKKDIAHLPPERLVASILNKEERIAQIVAEIQVLLKKTNNE
jgi:hypothetical protein